MNTLRITLLVIQFGVIGFLLLYALPRMIKSHREFKKRMGEVRMEIEETRKLTNLCMPIFEGRATDADIAAFQAHRKKWEEKHGRVLGEHINRGPVPKDFS